MLAAAARRRALALHPRVQQARTQSTALPSAPAPTPSPPPLTEPPLPATLPPATHKPPTRLDQLRRSAKPFSAFLTDSFSRKHTYLRLSITERCNLRCLYCMPAAGVPLSPPAHLLSTPELLELSDLFVAEGVTKIRLTGGEPTVRRDVFELVDALGGLRDKGLDEIAMTSNGVVLGTQGGRKLQRLVDGGLRTLNLSLDTLVPAKFEFMTRRRGLENVLRTMEYAREMGFGRDGSGRRLKVNCVVMNGVNEDEMLDFVDLTRDRNVEVRFIEYMPFDGNKWNEAKMLPYTQMVSLIRARHPAFAPLPRTPTSSDTSKTYRVPGYAGTVGFITSMTHNFCGTCNRLRVTSDGSIKVCLFDNTEVSLRDLLREYRARDEPYGAGEQARREEMRRRLLAVVGTAVRGKKERHAGVDWRALKDGKNRPMILIGQAHIIPISLKPRTHRTATAVARVRFSTPAAAASIRAATNRKGDVLAVARIAGIMGAKRTAELVPLCHPLAVEDVVVQVELGGGGAATTTAATTTTAGEERAGAERAGAVEKTGEEKTREEKTGKEERGEEKTGEEKTGDEEKRNGWVDVSATVSCTGKTGVEMEALTAAMVAALSVVDMCKAVDRGIVVEGCRVVAKSGGRSGDWRVES